ncbi:hypothetical protein AYI69_g8448, partial [Smittium culicis]
MNPLLYTLNNIGTGLTNPLNQPNQSMSGTETPGLTTVDCGREGRALGRHKCCPSFEFEPWSEQNSIEIAVRSFRAPVQTGVSHAEKLFDGIKIPEPKVLKNKGAAMTAEQTNVKVNFLKTNNDRKIARIKRVTATEDTDRSKRHKADDSKINELKQQIKDLA